MTPADAPEAGGRRDGAGSPQRDRAGSPPQPARSAAPLPPAAAPGVASAAPAAAPPRPAAWPGILALLICATLWSLNGPLIKLLAADAVHPVTIACYRSLIGGLVFLPIAWPRRRTLANVRPIWPIGTMLTFTFMTVCFVIATAQTAAANAILLQYTSPIWVFLLSPLLLREYPARSDGLVLLVAMAGIGIIFFGNPATDTLSLIIALGSGLGYGALTVLLRGLRLVDPFVVTAVNALGSGLLLLVPTVLVGDVLLSGRAWGLVLTLSFVQFTLPYVLFTWALQRVEAHRVSLIVLLETVLNPLLTYLVIGEHVPPATIIGGPLILVSVLGWLLLGLRRRRALRRAAAPAP